jgi:aldose 1-epimerase
MVSRFLFGVTPDGKQIDLYRIVNSSKAELSIITYGAIIQSIQMPDRNGVHENVVLGFDNLESYLSDKQYLGAIVGRYGGRIASGKLTLDGAEYDLTKNERGNHLHGGAKGFNKVVWTAEIISGDAIRLSYLSEDGEEGYPGNLKTYLTYTLKENNEVHVDVAASTDQNTIVNIVQHSYFNLTGKNQSILDHFLKINAKIFLPVDRDLIPLGEKSPVSNTPFDFTIPTSIGSRIQFANEQLRYANGYDHCWIVDHPKSGINEVAELYDEANGRRLTVWSDLPVLLIYSGNYLSGNFQQYGGVCLETEHFPDASNQPKFPTSIVTPSNPYSSSTIFKFSTQEYY